jgi:L-rhamnose-H+ transport protein
MNIVIGLLIIAVGAFCQSSCYVPINRIREWSWESYWLVQGIFAWALFPLCGALLAVPSGGSLTQLFVSAPSFNLWMTVLFGMLWGVGGLTFGLSMRYLGVALGQSLALGTCAGLGTIMGPVLLHVFFPEQNALAQLTSSVLVGVAVTLIGIAVIGVAGGMKNKEKEAAADTVNTEFDFGKGIAIALLAGFMSGCFNVGLTFGADIHFEGTNPMYASLPATLLVTLGGLATNMAYCLLQNVKNHTFGDYRKISAWGNNLLFCMLAGALWYSQFFGLSLGKGFLTESPQMMTLSFCILMALNVIFSNVWGIILHEWRGCSRRTIGVLVAGIIILIISSFIPQLI